MILQMTDHRAIAVMANTYMSILIIIYFISAKPFAEEKVNNLHLFNEACIMLANYHMLLFTDFTNSTSLKFEIGWSLTFLVSFMIIINISIMLWSNFSLFVSKIC